MLRVCIVTLTLLMITLCENSAFAYTVSVTASPPESAVEIDKTTDVFNVCGSFSEDTTQRQESETTKCRWKYIDATAYSDEACTTIDTNVVSVITESDTEWSTDEIYTKNVTVKGLTVGINWIKFKMKYQINETGEDTELISNPVKIFVYKIEFIDEIPDYSLDSNKDSDNFFLRQHDETTGTADYNDLDIYYYILPEGLPINDVKITIREEDEEAENKFVKQMDGEKKTDGNYKTGNELNVKWSDVRDATGKFRANRFYTVQLEVDVNGVDETFKTPLGDADSTAKGYQCKEKCLVIHDLVFKHRPVVSMGYGETVAPDGPVYPFSAAIIGNYKLWKHGTLVNTVAWSAPPTNYSSGGFPTAPALPGRQAFTYQYPVLKASIDNDTAGASKHYIDIDNNNRSCAGGEATLMHRGHVEKGQSHGDYCFIQFWMYETASYSPYNIPGHSNAFHHEGDWEMVQLCVKLTGNKKSNWFLPHAATASQHYYGQTLAWRIDQSGTGFSQSFVDTDDNGNRVNIYIAENSHATYFRPGEIKTDQEKCGTQIQYTLPLNGFFVDDYVDKITSVSRTVDFQLVPLNHKTKRGIGDWPGFWGQGARVLPGSGAPNGPFLRTAEITTGYLNLNSKPVDFHNSCRKLIGGTPQPETGL